MEGMRISVEVEKPDNFDGSKSKDVDTWIFQVREHLALTVIAVCGHVPYSASLLRGNAAMWWRELCERNQRPANWDAFCRALREQFCTENFSRRGWHELATMHQYSREIVADFVFRFHATCLKIEDLSDAKKLDRFV